MRRSRRLGQALLALLAVCCRDPRPAPLPAPSAVEPAPPADTVAPAASAQAPRPAVWPRSAPAVIETDWCTGSVSALDEQTCFVLPDAPTNRLLVYLHGIVPPTPNSPQHVAFQKVVANAARRAGVAALIPRGLQGFSSKRHPGWWSWPNAAGAYEKNAPALVERFVSNQRALEELSGAKFARVYLAGSSAGAYFVCALAFHGDYEVDGFGAMSGGAKRSAKRLADVSPKPFYIGYGTYDSVGTSARALGDMLRRLGWPVRIREHPLGHGAREVYLDEAFEFWRAHGG